MLRNLALALVPVVLLIAGCTSNTPTPAADPDPEPQVQIPVQDQDDDNSTTTVSGIVRLVGDIPVPKKWALEKRMQKFLGQDYYHDKTWSIGKDQGLANCIVILRNRAVKKHPLKPQKPVYLDKLGVGYEPPVLVVTPGTEVICRNKASPCRGFKFDGDTGRNQSHNFLVMEGTEKKIAFRHPEIFSVMCSMPYGHGHVRVADTPHFAVTNADGQFAISDVPKGEYSVEVWHQGVGKFQSDAGPADVHINGKDEATLSYSVRAPKKSEKQR